MIFDTHAHYDDEAFDEDRDKILGELTSQGVGTIVNIGASIKSSQNTLKLTKEYDQIYGALGVHPEGTKELDEEKFLWLSNQVENEKIVAIGEIGLDYYWDTTDRETQKTWFVRQLDLAIEKNLPVVIHSRDAAADTMTLLVEGIVRAKRQQKVLTGVIHCFSYGVEIAKQCLELGFYLGIGGVVTFKNGKKLKEVVALAPMDKLVLETDCPYLAPVPYRGKRNNSRYLTLVAEEIAAIKGISLEEVLTITEENAKKLYRL